MCPNVTNNIQYWTLGTFLKNAPNTAYAAKMPCSEVCNVMDICFIIDVFGFSWSIFCQLTMCLCFDSQKKAHHGDFYAFPKHFDFGHISFPRNMPNRKNMPFYGDFYTIMYCGTFAYSKYAAYSILCRFKYRHIEICRNISKICRKYAVVHKSTYPDINIVYNNFPK